MPCCSREPKTTTCPSYSPSDVSTAILSHLHQDHIGGLAELTGSDLRLGCRMGRTGQARPGVRGFLRSHIQLPGLKWHQVSLEPADDPALAPFTESLDVMGHGSLVLLPTPRPHRRLGVTADPPRLDAARLLAGDLTYGAEILQRGQLPGVGNRRRLAESSHKVLALAQQQPGLVVCPPTTRQPPSGCWTADTGDHDGNIPEHRHDRPARG